MASTDSRMPRMKTSGRSSVMRGYPRQAVLLPVDCVPPHHAESQVRSAAAVPQAARRAYERKEFPACGGVGAEHAEHAAGDHGGALLVTAARRHAALLRLADDRNALRAQHRVDPVGALTPHLLQIGRASCTESVCSTVRIFLAAESK